MLVLRREQGEEILIGEIRVKVISVGRSVLIGIEAPKDMPIHRLEAKEKHGRDPRTVVAAGRSAVVE